MSERGTGINFGSNNGFSPTVAVSTQLRSVASLLRPAKPGNPLPPHFEPGPKDICSGRGKRNWNHAGNIAFRNIIQSNVEAYIHAPSKNEKTAIVCNIVDSMRRDGYRFLHQNNQGLWYDIGDAKARDKVGHSLRDQVTAIHKGQAELKPSGGSSTDGIHVAFQVQEPLMRKNKKSVTLMQKMQQLYEAHQHMMVSSDNEAEAEESYRRRRNSAHTIEKFARRPSWIAGELSSSSESMEGVSAVELERRRSSASGLLSLVEGNILQDLMDMDTSNDDVADHAQSHPGDALHKDAPNSPSNEYGYNYSHTVAAVPPTMAPAQNWSLQLSGLNQDPLPQYRHHGYSNPSIQPLPAPSTELPSSQSPLVARQAPHVTTDSELAMRMEEDDIFDADADAAPFSKQTLSDSANLLLDSVNSWDPRSSLNSAVGSVRLSDIAGSGNSFPHQYVAQRNNSLRLSGATLRRATNIIRMSELSMASDLLEGLADWSDGDDYEEV